MTSVLTIAFSGKSPILQTNFLPEIMLDDQYDYSCALLDLIIENRSSSKIDIPGLIRINCDIISGSYINGVREHTIHQFAASTSLETGQNFVEIPKHLNYFPVKTNNLQSIQISIVDHEGKSIKNEGDINIRINIKRDDRSKST